MFAEALTQIKTPNLKLLLKVVHTGTISCPLTPAGLASVGLQDASGPILATLRGLDERAVRAVLVATLAERLQLERRLRSG